MTLPKLLHLFALCIALTATFAAPLDSVVLTESTRFPVFVGGKQSGDVTVPQGTTVKVISAEGDQLRVQYRDMTAIVPASRTNFLALQSAELARVEAEDRQRREAEIAARNEQSRQARLLKEREEQAEAEAATRETNERRAASAAAVGVVLVFALVGVVIPALLAAKRMGLVFILGGAVGFYRFWTYDTAVRAAGETVHNLGLLQNRAMGLVAALFVWAIGVLIVYFNSKD